MYEKYIMAGGLTVEEQFVRDMIISRDFSRTRSRAWPEIVEYLKNMETPSTILEVGW